MKFLDPLAKSFEFKGSNKGVLLIHGFTGSPFVLRFLGEHLNKKGGYTVKAPLLKGHGTSIEDMEKASWKDWIDDVKNAHKELEKECSKVYVVGYSMGGLLAIILASGVNPDKLVLIAPTLIIQSPKDDLVDPKSGDLIYNKINSEQKELFWLKESIHICTIGPEKDTINEKITEFVSL